jgi:hypothetical protein
MKRFHLSAARIIAVTRFRLFSWLAMMLVTTPVAAQPPSITYATPAAVAPGSSVDVTLVGANLKGASQLWSDLDLKAELAPLEKNGSEADKVVFHVTAPADAAVGIGGLRVATDKGVSNLRLVMIDDLPSVAEAGKNKSPQTAQELKLPIAVDGACEAESYDYYKFTATKGQRVSLEIVARRLGSPLDPVVRLMDDKGHELAYSDDEAGIGGDCRLAFRAPADGSYVLEVRDIQYAGGAGHRYRLRIGDFPLVTVSYPLAVQRGVTSLLTVSGSDAAGTIIQDITVPAGTSETEWTTGAKFPGGQGSALVRLEVDDRVQTLEAEPNDSIREATSISVPASLNGRFLKDKDRDYYRLAVKKGDRLVFRGVTRSLGSPSDLFMRLYKEDGSSLAEAEDSGMEEGTLNHTFAADGTYYLMVEDLLRRGGSEHGYRVEIEPYQAGFSLTLDNDKFDAPQSGVFVTKVTCARRDYKGPITLELQGAGEGFQLANNVIAEGKNDTTMSVTLPERCQPGQLAALAVVGKAKIDGRDVAVRATSEGALLKQLPGVVGLSDDLTRVAALGVAPPFADFFKLSVDPATVTLPQVVASGTFKVKAEKLNKFDDAIALAIEGLPAGVTAEVKPIEKGKPEAVVTLKGTEALAVGEHHFKLVAKATFQNQPKTVTIGDVPLRIVKPLAAAASIAGPIAPGGKQKLKVTLTRYGEPQPAVTLSLKNLPEGVTAPAEASVPEGKSEVEIELAAADDAKPVKADNVIVVAATKLKDQDLLAEAAPIAVEVKAATESE